MDAAPSVCRRVGVVLDLGGFGVVASGTNEVAIGLLAIMLNLTRRFGGNLLGFLSGVGRLLCITSAHSLRARILGSCLRLLRAEISPLHDDQGKKS